MAAFESIPALFRWVGGKQQLLQRLLERCPPRARDRRYFEPFLGAASLFLALRPKRAILGDANLHLVRTYEKIRDDPRRVSQHLSILAEHDGPANYYSARASYNRSGFSAAQAARFIYLNRTCFNGIFRVNKRGEFNVPYGFTNGYKKMPSFPSLGDLESAGRAFAEAKLVAGSYWRTLKSAGSGDFAYLDPPYPALNGTSMFTHYTMDRFSAQDQAELAQYVRDLDRRGCLVMMSNADTPTIRRLYRGFAIDSLAVNRWVTCKSVKHVVDELVITNY